MWRAAPLIVLVCCGATCQPRPPKVETVYVTVEKMVDVPEELTRDCYDEQPKEQTYSEAKRLANLRHESLTECTGRMAEIRELGSP
jgi:hypothetical protein